MLEKWHPKQTLKIKQNNKDKNYEINDRPGML